MPLPPETLSEQPLAQSPGDEGDLLYSVQAGQTRRMTRAILRTGIFSTLQSFIRTFLTAANSAAARTAIGAVGSADNITGSAAKLTTARNIAASGDGTWTVSFDGSANASAALTLAASGVSAGTYGSVTVNAKGLVTGATTVTPVANGGTGRATVALYLADLVTAGAYSKTSILGTVSQTAGVPTGSVIETGGTLSGTGVYTKFADGTMIIRKTLAIATGCVTPAGSIFRSAATDAGNFPIAFIGTAPAIALMGSDSSGGGWPAMDIFGSLTAWGSYSTRNHISSGTSCVVHLTATGRWF